MTKDEEEIEKYRKKPDKAIRRCFITQEQALAAVETKPSIYPLLTTYILATDPCHDYALLRAAVAADPNYLAMAYQTDDIPTDLLLVGLQSADVWDKIVNKKWAAYDNKCFQKKHPKIVELIKMYREFGLDGESCFKAYHSWQCAQNNVNEPGVSVELPAIDSDSAISNC